VLETLSIKRRKPEHSEAGFDSLRREALKLIQQISGERWTDYNLHDPGITILEQLIYSITDLIYRTEFAVEDYLASEDGSLDLETLGLHVPAEVLPCRATTSLDYRKLLLNAVPVADNLWVDALTARSQAGQYRGLYQFSVKLEQGLEESARNDAVEQLRATYLGARNLCEDIGQIRIVDSVEFELCASIEVSSKRQPVDILAEIYFACARCIASSVSITGYDQVTEQIPTFDQLFDGPFTGNGFFRKDDLPDHQAGFQVSSLFSVINSVEAVDHVQQLYLARDNEDFYVKIEALGPDEACDLRIPHHFEDIKVVLTTNGRELPVALDELITRYDEIAFKYHTSRSTPQDLSLLYEPISAVYRPLGQYSSIQNQFPVSYGINKLGVPASAPVETKAKARQLKAYLVVFEQLLTNFLANLDSIKMLFSMRVDSQVSYSNQALSDRQINDLSAVYPSATGKEFSRVVAGFDNYFERKSRLLDYLLALYGEKFSQNSLRHFSFYCERDEVEAAIVANKLAFLESIVELARDRAAGDDYSRPIPERSRCGLALRVAMLLGIGRHQGRFLSDEIVEQDLELLPHQDYQKRKEGSHEFRVVNLDETGESSADVSEPPPLIKPDQDLSPRQLREKLAGIVALKNHLLSEKLLTGGIRIDRYRIVRPNSARDYDLAFLLDEKRYWNLGSYSDKTSAIEAANHLRQFLLLLNKNSEGLHVVEHILLRPLQQAAGSGLKPGPDQDFFSFRISVIFPLWTTRFQDKQFRLLAEETVRLNAPAHIWADIYWLDFPQMIEFERIYQHWVIVKSDGNSEAAEVDHSAQQLSAFLQQQRAMMQEGL